jgi:4-amino-4-deoxy-L-arabinose transferase-like glycosyltransferase
LNSSSCSGTRNATPWLIALVGLLAQAGFVAARGMQLAPDTNDYTACWQFIAAHGWPAFSADTPIRGYYHLGYCAAGAAVMAAGASVPATLSVLLAAQVAAAGMVPLWLFLALRAAGDGPALLGALIALMMPILYCWTPYMLSDTFYIAGMAAVLPLAGVVLERRRGPAAWAAAAGIALACAARPPGMLLMVILGGVLFLAGWRRGLPEQRRRPVWPAVVLWVAAGLYWGWFFGIARAHLSRVPTDLGDFARTGVIVHAMPQYDLGPSASEGGLAALRHGLAVSLTRAYYFFKPNYPHHSMRHQLANLAMWVPLYLFALWGMIRRLSGDDTLRQLRRLAVVIVGYHAVLAMLTIVEPDHRFLAPVFPALIFLAVQALRPRRVA